MLRSPRAYRCCKRAVSGWVYAPLMLNSSCSPGAPVQESWAELRAHDRVTRYRRRGAGQPVLVLRASDDSPLWSTLVDALSAAYRVIVPEIEESDRDNPRRLADFLEGLGCSNVIVVADIRFSRATLELAAFASDQIGSVILVVERPNAQPLAVRTAPVPVFIVDAHLGPSEIALAIKRFVARTP